LIEKCKDLLTALELSGWEWDINQVLQQPEAELEIVTAMKILGEKFRIQGRNKRDESKEVI
jgi:hypothetical protein